MSITKAIKTNWETEKNQRLLNRYKELDLIPFSCVLEEISKKDSRGEMVPKKNLDKLPPHSTITKFQQQYIRTYNGLCLKMGTKTDDGQHIILVDIDNKNDTMEKWVKVLNSHIKTTLKTPTATTGNGGLHYLFKVPQDMFVKLQNSYTGLIVNGDKLDIDVKGHNGLQLAEPTKYTALDGTTKKYNWTNNSIYKYAILPIPMWLYDIILKSSSTPVAVRVKVARIDPNSSHHVYEHKKLVLDLFTDMKVKPTQEELEYFNLFSFDRLDDTSTWISVGFLCYSMYEDATGFKVWNELSRLSAKYNQERIVHTWRKSILNRPKRMTKGSLLKYAESDNKEEYDKLKQQYRTLRGDIANFINDDPFIDDGKDIFIDQRYLLDKDNKLNDNTILVNTVTQFFS